MPVQIHTCFSSEGKRGIKEKLRHIWRCLTAFWRWRVIGHRPRNLSLRFQSCDGRGVGLFPAPPLPGNIPDNMYHIKCPCRVWHLFCKIFAERPVVRSWKCTEATLKKLLFPVQRVAAIVASRAATILYLKIIFFWVC